MDDINLLSTAAAPITEPLGAPQPTQLQIKEMTLVTADQTITGRVTDGATGSGLPGVSVVVKGTSRGTTTDTDGNYRVKYPTRHR